jgi:hypothetical protein
VNNITVTVGGFGSMKYGELKNESGRTMTLQGAGVCDLHLEWMTRPLL